MNGSHLLDTNIVIRFLKDEEPVKRAMAAADQVFVSCIVLGELIFGAKNSLRPADNLNVIEEFVHLRPVLDCDRETARYFGDIKATLRRKGRPIPENDICIAAHVMQYGLTLVTGDMHFREIDGLVVESW